MSHASPRRFLPALAFAALILALPVACKSTETHDHAATTADSVVDMGGSAGQTQLRLDQALVALEDVAERGSMDPKPAFDEFAAKLGKFQGELQDFGHERIRFEDRADTWLAEFTKRNATIQDPELRKYGEIRVGEFQQQIGDLTQQVDGLLTDAIALETRLRDMRTFLGNDLTPKAVRNVSGRIDEIARDGRKIAERLGQFSKASEETAGKLRAARAPEPTASNKVR